MYKGPSVNTSSSRSQRLPPHLSPTFLSSDKSTRWQRHVLSRYLWIGWAMHGQMTLTGSPLVTWRLARHYLLFCPLSIPTWWLTVGFYPASNYYSLPTYQSNHIPLSCFSSPGKGEEKEVFNIVGHLLNSRWLISSPLAMGYSGGSDWSSSQSKGD